MQQLEITSTTDFELAIKQYALVLFDFYKENCTGCKMLDLALAQLAQQPLASHVVLAKVKLEVVGEEFFLAQRLRQTPTLLLFYQGREIVRSPGFTTIETILNWLQPYQAHTALSHG